MLEDGPTFTLRSPKPGVTPSKDSLPLKILCIFKYRERQRAMKSDSRSQGTRQLMYYREDSGCQSGSMLLVTEGLLRLWPLNTQPPV